MNINRKRALEFLQNIIKINSINPPGNELEVANAIVSHSRSSNLETHIRKITHDRANVLVKLRGKYPDKPKLIFSGHLDTVPAGEIPWDFAPFSGTVIKQKLYGRGASDMKSGVAGMIEAMINLKEANFVPNSDIIFIGTAGEEVDCLGAKRAVEEGMIENPGAIIISEPSNNRVCIAHKGALWLEVKIFGKTAHGSMPHEGVNAIGHMIKFFNELERYQFPGGVTNSLLGEPSFSLGTIKGGVKTNVVPDNCSLTIDFRTIPELSHQRILSDIKQIIEKLKQETNDFKATVKILNDLPPLFNNENDDFIKLSLQVANKINEGQTTRTANYYTDASIFGPAYNNIPIIIYGPGDDKLAHQPNEYVELSKYYESIEYFMEMAKVF